MSNFRTANASTPSRRHLLHAVIPMLLLGACTEAANPPPVEPSSTITARVIDNETGEVREVTGTADMLVLEDEADESTTDVANCTTIRFCTRNVFTANDVVCDTNNQACSANARFSECNIEARNVCGKTRPMAFDPAIPCPLAGVSTLLCASGESLFWIGSTGAVADIQ